jgi:hypothetical protein
MIYNYPQRQMSFFFCFQEVVQSVGSCLMKRILLVRVPLFPLVRTFHKKMDEFLNEQNPYFKEIFVRLTHSCMSIE